jgi:hypothetical protein
MSRLPPELPGRIAAARLFLRGKLRDEEIVRAVTRQVALEHKQRRLNAASHLVGSQQTDDPRVTLYRKIVATMERLFSRPPPSESSIERSPFLPASPPPPRPTLVERIADVFTPSEPEPPPLVQSPLVRADGSGAQVIPDEEYMPSVRSIATENWKKSVLENQRLHAERRGTPRSPFIG